MVTRATRGKGSTTPRNNGKFIKGIGGNPGGRRKLDGDVVNMARANTVLAINTLAEICRNKKAQAGARVIAAGALLDRGWGRAISRTETRMVNVDLNSLSDQELLALLDNGQMPAQAEEPVLELTANPVPSNS